MLHVLHVFPIVIATYKNSSKSGRGDEEGALLQGESEPWLWEEGVLVEVRETFSYRTISCMPIDVI